MLFGTANHIFFHTYLRNLAFWNISGEVHNAHLIPDINDVSTVIKGNDVRTVITANHIFFHTYLRNLSFSRIPGEVYNAHLISDISAEVICARLRRFRRNRHGSVI